MTNATLEQRVERLEELVGQLLGQQQNPWARFAGVWKDDPSFDEFLAAIAEHRRQTDAALDPSPSTGKAP